MTLDEIKAAVLAGKVVRWVNSRYRVVHCNGDWSITCDGGSTIGLTHADGITVNCNDPSEFYIEQTGN